MAGAGYRTWTDGAVVSASQVQTYLQDQSVMVFASSAARGSAIAAPSEGMMSYLQDSDTVQVYNGSSWTALSGKAAVTSSTGSPTIDTTSRPGKSIYKWTGSGSVVVTAGVVEALIVGGGGNGDTNRGGSGGGIIPASIYLTAGTHTVTVGAGGTNGASGFASAGKASSVGAVTTGYANGYNTGNFVGAGATSGAPTTGYSSTITGGTVTYARGGQSSPAANSGDGGQSASTIAGADGVVILVFG